MSYRPKVVFDHPNTVRDTIRFLVDADTIELRDLALSLLDDLVAARAEVERLRAGSQRVRRNEERR